MASVAVENPLNQIAPHNRRAPSSIPNIDLLQDLITEDGDDYSTFKKLQRQKEYIHLQEEYIKDEQRLVMGLLLFFLNARIFYL